MPKYRTVDYSCTSESCGHKDILLLDLLDPADAVEGEPLATRDCPICGGAGTFHRTLAMPSNLRASYHDGVKRKGWQDLREVNKLRREQAHSKGRERRNEIAREIKKLGGRTDG